ncbi:MAG: NADP-dependent malic enzyme [Alphaproteobacteria bacterium]|nr:NADP-dependent malic enzyme [Alphaproteobacteria bacterium]
MDEKQKALAEDALRLHREPKPGKIEITPSKPLTTQRDLALAYSPGVAVPCLEIEKDPDMAFEYTTKGNLVAVISNGTAVLGLGNIGALASKPVMEGKAVLFKRFADIDSVDLEVDTEVVDEFVNSIRYLGKSFGGINLEDIKAPDCFVIEEQLKELLDIPVFHDDQHGTAIIAAAGIINALHLTGKSLDEAKMVINGAGAAGIACAELLKSMGMPQDNITMCDTRGVIYRGRPKGMNQWKSAHAIDTDKRTLEEAVEGADIFFGLSVKGAMTQDMVKSMGKQPIIFAMANPDPEILPEDVKAVRPEAIVATGRSDYPNQVNNVLGFPYIFRGALDVRATAINMEMKIAAAEALAKLAREDVPDEVDRAYSGRRLQYGPDYIIPAPFDPRLIGAVSSAVAKAAMETGVARKPIADMVEYCNTLSARLDPTGSSLQSILDQLAANPRRVVFCEGEQEAVIRAAVQFKNAGYGTPILVGREDEVKATMKSIGIKDPGGIEIANARLSDDNEIFTDFLYRRLQRQGSLLRDCQRMVNQNRNVFGACMLAQGRADALVTGLTRSFHASYEDIRRVIDVQTGQVDFSLNLLVRPGRTVFIADTSVNELPTAKQLADIAVQTAKYARSLGHEPRVAFLSFSNFGNPPLEKADRIREAVDLMDYRGDADFEYDGEMAADVALDFDLMRKHYPFCRLTGPANILVMPALHSAHITQKLFSKVTDGISIGPILIGLDKSAQIVQMGATVSDIVNMAALAAYEALVKDRIAQPRR